MDTSKGSILRTNLLRRLLFLCLPTVAFILILFKSASAYYALLNNQYILHTVYFAVATLISCTLFSMRLRFIPISLILVALLAIASSVINSLSVGEFDSFFLSIHFRLFSILFVAGWICGWGFARLRYFPILLSSLLLLINLVLVSKITDVSFEKILLAFAPTLLFAFYIIYMGEAIRSISETKRRAWLYLSKRLVAFAIFVGLLFALSALILTPSFRAVESEWNNGSDAKDEGLMKKNSDSTYNVKDNLRTGNNNSGKNSEPIPMFIAYLDNFLEGTDGSEIPNPLYFTCYYLPKFDTYTETFERDSIVPFDDLFKPNPSQIPLYFTATDSSVLVKGLSDQFRKEVTADVYKIKLAPDEFVAPTTSFFCQPIAVEKDFKDQFMSAYRTKSYVSELNSAYFVYPSRDLDLQQYQLQRFDILNQVRNFDDVPRELMDYYTQMPTEKHFDSIRALAAHITRGAETPAQKIIAIRDYFMSKDEYGKPLYKYSDNPGIPGIPSASKLATFLFETHTGYCAHYAGAALFLLRSCGIPSRVTVGFATVDRSSKNKGWYWFYEDQAHAWVQVFFPEYGWIDFDFTMGNEDMQEAPTADGTPPMQPQKAHFAGKGTVVKVYTDEKLINFDLEKMVFHDKEYTLKEHKRIVLDMKVATIEKDSLKLTLDQVRVGETGLAVSFAEALGELIPEKGQAAEEILGMFQSKVPIDELHIDGEKEKKSEDFFEKEGEQSTPLSLLQLLLILLIAVAVLIVALLLSPYIVFRYYRSKIKRSKRIETKAYHSYRTALFLLNQLGCTRDDLTPLQLAQQKVDPMYETNFTSFMLVYLKLKYANQTLTTAEEAVIDSFYQPFEKQVNSKHPFGYRLRKFANFYQMVRGTIRNKE